MDIADFFSNNIYILFGIFIYTIFNNDKLESDNNKIIIIYSLIIGLFLFNSLNIYFIILTFLLLFFFQFEFFTKDTMKKKIVYKLSYKLFDTLYLLIFKYNFLLFLVILYLLNTIPFSSIDINNLDFNLIGLTNIIHFVLCVLLFFYLINFISNDSFEMNSFKEINEMLKLDTFNDFEIIDDRKLDILINIEDRTFLWRKNSYTSWSLWILLSKAQTLLNILVHHEEIKIYGEVNVPFKYKIKRAFSILRNQFRGYSTIEMQLCRQVMIKNGYYKTIRRKFLEWIYTPILFGGIKKHFKNNYSKVSNKRFKQFIALNYLNYARAFMGKKSYSSYNELFKDKEVISDMDFILYVLSLSGKLSTYDVLSGDLILSDVICWKYYNTIRKNYYTYDFEDDLNASIDWINEKNGAIKG